MVKLGALFRVALVCGPLVAASGFISAQPTDDVEASARTLENEILYQESRLRQALERLQAYNQKPASERDATELMQLRRNAAAIGDRYGVLLDRLSALNATAAAPRTP